MKAGFKIPIPPSVNAAYGHRQKGQRGRGRFITPELARWRQLAGAAIQAAGRLPRFPAAVSVSILAREPDGGRQRDIDNVNKATLDLLVELGVIVDDCRKIVRKVSAEWVSADEIPHGNIQVSVVEVEAAPVMDRRKPAARRGKGWVLQQLKRRYGIEISPERVHVQG